MDVVKEKYMGESQLSQSPKKKIGMIIRDGAITKQKLSDGLQEKIDDIDDLEERTSTIEAMLSIPFDVFCGDWVDGSQVAEPVEREGIYLAGELNPRTMLHEIHSVRHNNGTWRCLQKQPIINAGVSTYYEPKWNSPYWQLVDGNEGLSIGFSSSNGYSFRMDFVDTDITSVVYAGNVDITGDIAAVHFNWTRNSDRGHDAADDEWASRHRGMKNIHLSNADMPTAWGYGNRAIFTLTVDVPDGKNYIQVNNVIIA